MLFTPHPAETLNKTKSNYKQHNTPHGHNHKNTRSNIRSQAHFRKSYTKHDRQSEEHHKNTKSAYHYSLGEIQGNTTKHIHCHHQNNTRGHLLYQTQTQTNYKPYKIQRCASPQDARETQAHNICMKKQAHYQLSNI